MQTVCVIQWDCQNLKRPEKENPLTDAEIDVRIRTMVNKLSDNQIK